MILERVEVAVAIGTLGAVFMVSLFILIFICRQRILKQKDQGRELLVPPAQLEMGDLRLHPDIEQILADEQWIGDATGLVPHCLAVLKSCHQLTERLAAVAMGPMHKSKLQRVTEMARQTSSRVDAVVRCMYPPLDARLLEARTSVLVLTVAHLATATRHACRRKLQHRLDHSIDSDLADMEIHLQVLRQAALSQESASQLVPASVNTPSTSLSSNFPPICLST